MKCRGLAVFRVETGSIAEEIGLAPGDRILAINGEPVRDLIDYKFLEADENLSIHVKKKDCEDWNLDLEKDFDQSLGIEFGSEAFGCTTHCSNKCIFCFVDQMPPGMRKTLYIKDDDYRLSFWNGHFITLTNLGDEELQRIAEQRLSPLYISVHTTNPSLREKMLGNPKAGLIMEQMRYLAGAGIEMHTQAVLCPGLNDGRELERTTADLVGLWPEVRSLAVVPVGLTKFRNGLYPLRPFTRNEARKLVRWVGSKQEEYLAMLDHPFIFASDEFYLLSGASLPSVERYADFPQLENGVGLTRLFLDEWENVRDNLPSEARSLKATLVTGQLGEKVLRMIVSRLKEIKGLDIKIKVINNNFFGKDVTVTGLITGQDLIRQIKPDETGDLLVIPAIMIKKDKAVFLDGLSLPELATHLNSRVAVVDGPQQLIDVLLKGPEKAERYIKPRS